jgi:hypothetical protein
MNEGEQRPRQRASRQGSSGRLVTNDAPKFELSFTDLAMSGASPRKRFEEGRSRPSKMEACVESPGTPKVKEKLHDVKSGAKDALREAKSGRTTKKIRGTGQKTIGDMFVEDDFGAVSFGDDVTTTSATTATTKSSAAKIVPVKVESALDMDPFANIDYGVGFSDWNYSAKDSASSTDTAKAAKSRRRSSMSNVVASDYHHSVEPKEEPIKEQRRQSRRSSLDLALCAESKASRRREGAAVSSGVSARSNGSRGSRDNGTNSSSEEKQSRREGSRDAKAPRGDRRSKLRPDHAGRRRNSLGGTKIIEEVNQAPAPEQKAEPRKTSKRASLNMVAGNSVAYTDPSPRRSGRRASLDMKGGVSQTAFVSDNTWQTGGAKVHEWDDDGFQFIK